MIYLNLIEFYETVNMLFHETKNKK